MASLTLRNILNAMTRHQKNGNLNCVQYIIFYDGYCALCHFCVRYVMAADKENLFFFSPLQGKEVKKRFDLSTRNSFPDSIVVWVSNEDYRVKSDAVIFILQEIGGLYSIFGVFLELFPRRIRDFGYDCVARYRKTIVGEKIETCPLVPDELKKKIME